MLGERDKGKGKRVSRQEGGSEECHVALVLGQGGWRFEPLFHVPHVQVGELADLGYLTHNMGVVEGVPHRVTQQRNVCKGLGLWPNTEIFFFLNGGRNRQQLLRKLLPPQKLRRGKTKMDRPIEDEEFCPVLSKG